jgi:transposase InsO family protein
LLLWLDDGSRMIREDHVRFCEGPRVQLPRPTHPYIPMEHGFLYLVAVIDWASRAVLAWRLSNTMDTRFCIDALDEALARYGAPRIFNTDQGSQFTSEAFTGRLIAAGVAISMDGRGRFLDNKKKYISKPMPMAARRGLALVLG